MISFTAAQRRARLVQRHRLVAPFASSTLDAAESVLALHATDPATVYLSVLARCPSASLADVATAMYEDRTLVRMLAMRRTLFVVPVDAAPVVHVAASLEVAATQRRRLLKDLATTPTDPPVGGDVDAWLTEVESATEAALLDRGAATANQLASDVPQLRTAQLPTTDKAWDVRRAITTRVVTVLGAQGRIVRGRPRGTWTSRAHTWEPARLWWPDGWPALSPDDARAELVRRWLRVFGPATVKDVQWWTGWSLGATKKALAAVHVVDVDLDGVPGIGLADDLEVAPSAGVAPSTGVAASAEPTAVLLPALDPTPMGWTHRDWFFAVDRKPLFDRFGNVGPTVWWDGEVVGGWAVRPDGSVAWRLLTDRGRDVATAVGDAASTLEKRLAGAAVVPSFPTPLERELRTG